MQPARWSSGAAARRHWIAGVCADEQCGPAGFAAGLLSDLDAVVYGMSRLQG
ncbi:hypothetical protein ACWEO4_40045 [Streptomyces sp. NPDC004393]